MSFTHSSFLADTLKVRDLLHVEVKCDVYKILCEIHFFNFEIVISFSDLPSGKVQKLPTTKAGGIYFSFSNILELGLL
jgi:hypothetical protein